MTKVRIITLSQIHGNIAKWICRQSPYRSVAGVDEINRTISSAAVDWGPSIFKMKEFANHNEIYQWLWSALQYDLTFKMLGTSKKTKPQLGYEDMMAHLKANNGRYAWDDDPDYSFIDLYALLANVATSCWEESISDI